MLNRRRFLAGASGTLLAVTLGRSSLPRAIAESATPTEPDTFPYRIAAPGLTFEGAFPEVQVSQLTPFQGGAIYVSAANALAGVAEVFGRQYPLLAGARALEGFVGIGPLDPAGPATLVVRLVDQLNQPANYGYDLTIRQTQWTFDSIIIPPPDPNAPPSNEPTVPDEQPRLNQIYAGVTERQWDMPWQIPIALGGDVSISSYFGEERSYNGGPRQGHHGGTDIAAPFDTPIHATNHGTVVLAELTLNRGNLVVLDHGSGIFSCYGHQKVIRVSVGDFVHRGDVLGIVGTTGLSTGPHCHWEMSVGGVLVDGLRWLDGTQGF